MHVYAIMVRGMSLSGCELENPMIKFNDVLFVDVCGHNMFYFNKIMHNYNQAYSCRFAIKYNIFM